MVAICTQLIPQHKLYRGHIHQYDDHGPGTIGFFPVAFTNGVDNLTNTRTTMSSGNHNHSLDISAFNSATNGNHNHNVTISSGGSGTAFNLYQPYMVANAFIYLGR